jgi:hypothetical protein
MHEANGDGRLLLTVRPGFDLFLTARKMSQVCPCSRRGCKLPPNANVSMSGDADDFDLSGK